MLRQRVSVIIPTFNRKEKLERCLNSLSKQTLEPLEIIIIDDGSDDGTRTFLIEISKKNKKIKFASQSNKGSAIARNNGIDKAKGEIIGFIDDDCIADQNWVKNAITYFKNKEVIGVEGKTFFNKKPYLESGKKYVGFLTCNIFYYKDILKKIKGFDKRLISFREDTDLAWRCMKYGKIERASNVIMNHPNYEGKKDWKAYASDVLLYSKFPKEYLGFAREGGCSFIKNILNWGGVFYGILKYKKGYPFIRIFLIEVRRYFYSKFR